MGAGIAVGLAVRVGVAVGVAARVGVEVRVAVTVGVAVRVGLGRLATAVVSTCGLIGTSPLLSSQPPFPHLSLSTWLGWNIISIGPLTVDTNRRFWARRGLAVARRSGKPGKPPGAMTIARKRGYCNWGGRCGSGEWGAGVVSRVREWWVGWRKCGWASGHA